MYDEHTDFLLGAALLPVLLASWAYFIWYVRTTKKYNILKEQVDKERLDMHTAETRQLNQVMKNYIHDEVLQIYFFQRLSIDSLRKTDSNETRTEIANHADLAIKQAIHEARLIAFTLDIDTISRSGIREILQEGLEYINKVNPFNYCLDITYAKEPDLEIRVFILRIVMTIVYRIAKQQSAATLDITLSFQENHFLLTIKADQDGPFIDNILSDQPFGTGYFNERAKALNCELNISTKANERIIVSCIIPVNGSV